MRHDEDDEQIMRRYGEDMKGSCGSEQVHVMKERN